MNCLNFGNPEHPEVMWELSEAIDGMSTACRAFDLPVVGGNVSLYNETRGMDIDPTPVVGVLGMINPLRRRPPSNGFVDRCQLMLIGPDALDLVGSAATWPSGGEFAPLDLELHKSVADLVRGCVNDGLVRSIHDLADGLAVAVCELAARGDCGATLGLGDVLGCFGETPSQVLIATTEAELIRARAGHIAVRVVGATGGDRVKLGSVVDLSVHDVRQWYTRALPDAFETAVAH